MRPWRRATLAIALWLCVAQARADGPRHCLWEIHGKHGTVFLLGSIHVLRPSDYPLAPVILDAYERSSALVMEIDLADIDTERLRQEMLEGATLPPGQTLEAAVGPRRYARAATLARQIGVDLSTLDRYAPWFAAEAVSQVQLTRLGFEAQSGVEMVFLDKARQDGKPLSGLETVHDQVALFDALSLDAQADYLVSSLEEAHQLPSEVNHMVSAWQHGDLTWFEKEIKSEFGDDPALYESLLAARNRRWIPQLEALLSTDKTTLVIVGTGHLVGRDGLIALLKKDGIGATRR